MVPLHCSLPSPDTSGYFIESNIVGIVVNKRERLQVHAIFCTKKQEHSSRVMTFLASLWPKPSIHPYISAHCVVSSHPFINMHRRGHTRRDNRHTHPFERPSPHKMTVPENLLPFLQYADPIFSMRSYTTRGENDFLPTRHLVVWQRINPTEHRKSLFSHCRWHYPHIHVGTKPTIVRPQMTNPSCPVLSCPVNLDLLRVENSSTTTTVWDPASTDSRSTCSLPTAPATAEPT